MNVDNPSVWIQLLLSFFLSFRYITRYNCYYTNVSSVPSELHTYMYYISQQQYDICQEKTDVFRLDLLQDFVVDLMQKLSTVIRYI